MISLDSVLFFPGFVHSGFAGFMLLGGLLKMVLMASIIIFIVRRRKKISGYNHSSVRILAEKYASGEISEDDYLKRKSVLSQK